MSDTSSRSPYRDRTDTKTFHVAMKLGTATFEFDGCELKQELFTAWLQAATPDRTDVAAIVTQLKERGEDITKYSEKLLAIAAQMDATAPSSPQAPPLT